MAPLVQDNSLSLSQQKFLQNVLTEEGVAGLFTAAKRLHIPQEFILQKTMELWLKQSLKKQGVLQVGEISLDKFHISKKLNIKFDQSISRLLSYEPLKRKIKSKTKIKKPAKVKVSPKKFPCFPKILKTNSFFIRLFPSQLKSHCDFCNQSLFKEQKLIGCFCVQDLVKNIQIQYLPTGILRFQFDKHIEKEEIQTFLEIIRKEEIKDDLK